MPAQKTGSKTGTREHTQKGKAKKPKHPLAKEFQGVILIALAIALGISIYSGGLGMVGAFLKSLMLGLTGVFAYALAPLLFIIGVFLIADWLTGRARHDRRRR